MRILELPNCVVLALAPWMLVGAALAADDEPAKTPQPAIAATINGDPVYVAEVEGLMANLLKTRQVAAKDAPKTKAEMLRQTVNRRLAEKALREDGGYIKKADVDAALNKIKSQAQSQRLTLEQFTAQRGVDVGTLEHEMNWQIGWQNYLDRHLTAALEGYFKEHHKDLDGTQVRASHILLRPERPGEAGSPLLERAEKIRADIEAGKLAFEQAVEKYSVGPSRAQQGDLGFFPRYGVMVEDFSKAAFALEIGEISQPVSTAFGVHLIKATDIKPGTKQWTQALEQIKGPAATDLFTKLADKERASATIEYTGKMPYFKTGTDELVLPTTEKK